MQRAAAVRAEILEAARTLLPERGFEALTMRDVAARAGVALGTPYRYFKDKGDLTAHLIGEDFLELGRRLLAVKGRTARARLAGVCTLYFRFAREHPQRYRLLFMAPGMPSPKDAPSAPQAERGNPDEDSYAAFRVVVREALVEAGRPAGAAHADRATQLVWAGLHGLVGLELAPLQATWVPFRPWAELEKHLVTLLLDGVLGPA
ncbi:MAG: TetR/AcrR family transcriptional regulator [Gemmatimonadetes bacterium]|nr:TetR/AcrR family transcriptional regulator [Gemmatimonadota bacterium]